MSQLVSLLGRALPRRRSTLPRLLLIVNVIVPLTAHAAGTAKKAKPRAAIAQATAPAAPASTTDEAEATPPVPPASDAEVVQEQTSVPAAEAAAEAGRGTYDLDGLIALARRFNPGLAAADRATAFVRAQLSEARRSWLPTGDFTTLIAPSPRIRCDPDADNCVSTGDRDPNVGFAGVFSRTQITLTQPVYTFGKIDAGVEAARAGVEASKSREAAAAAELDLNVSRAYFGLKLAREIQTTLKEGLGYVEQAQDLVQKDLDEGGGNMTITDKLRLQTTRAELEAQMSEVGRGTGIAQNALRALLGPMAPAAIAVDAAPLEQRPVPQRPLSYYEEAARLSRPEVRALDYFVKAQVKLADLEFARQLPDLVLVGTATYAYASSVDDPRNAFFNDPFNIKSAGLALALRAPLDFGQRNAKAKQAEARAEEAAFRRREALGGIAFEVSRAYIELNEAQTRMVALANGEKLSRRWMTSIVQKLDLGLAETREVTDALRSYFTMRVRYLQAVHDYNIAAAALTRATGSQLAGG